MKESRVQDLKIEELGSEVLCTHFTALKVTNIMTEYWQHQPSLSKESSG
jgi:hypothetical protein